MLTLFLFDYHSIYRARKHKRSTEGFSMKLSSCNLCCESFDLKMTEYMKEVKTEKRIETVLKNIKWK